METCFGASCAQAEELTADGNTLLDGSQVTVGGGRGTSSSAAVTGSGVGTGSPASGPGGATNVGAGGPAGSGGHGVGGAGGQDVGGAGGTTSTGTGVDGGNQGGRGGSAGAGGTDAGSTCSSGCTLKVQYENVVAPPEPMTSTVRVRIDVVNAGTKTVALTDITVRYWFTDPGGNGDKVTCYYAQDGCSGIVTKFAPVAPARRGADRYLEIGFAASQNLLPGDHTGIISLGVQHASAGGAQYDQTDDYSYGANQPSLVDWTKITAYVGRTLTWGTEP
jgi:hypothetical protein